MSDLSRKRRPELTYRMVAIANHLSQNAVKSGVDSIRLRQPFDTSIAGLTEFALSEPGHASIRQYIRLNRAAANFMHSKRVRKAFLARNILQPASDHAGDVAASKTGVDIDRYDI